MKNYPASKELKDHRYGNPWPYAKYQLSSSFCLWGVSKNWTSTPIPPTMTYSNAGGIHIPFHTWWFLYWSNTKYRYSIHNPRLYVSHNGKISITFLSHHQKKCCGAHWNGLIETIPMSGHNICFCKETREIDIEMALLFYRKTSIISICLLLIFMVLWIKQNLNISSLWHWNLCCGIH